MMLVSRYLIRCDVLCQDYGVIHPDFDSEYCLHIALFTFISLPVISDFCWFIHALVTIFFQFLLVRNFISAVVICKLCWYYFMVIAFLSFRTFLVSWFLADRTIGRAFGTVCRLSSVCRLSVTFCIVEKRCVLAKKCLKEWIGNQGQRVHFLGRCHISTSGFAAMATETAVFALFLPVQPSNRY